MTITLIPFNEVRPSARSQYLVKGLIPRPGVILAWGQPKSGKTFWAFDLMFHVALNRVYRGHKVNGGPVVYCCFEGVEGYGQRAAALREHYLPSANEAEASRVPMHLVNARMDFAADHPALIAAIQETLGAQKPAAVVLDTLNRSLAGSESSDVDMAAYIRAADAVRDAFTCSVIVIHHSGHDTARPRGHSSISGAVDAQLSVKRNTADNIVVEVEFMRDGPEGERVVSRLEQIQVGTDADGDPITSCVVMPVDGPQTATARHGLSQRCSDALAALDGCAGADGFAEVYAWREELFRRAVINRDAGNSRSAFKRVKDTLLASHSIVEEGGRVCRAH
jgi:KaiC/GvpD/RAD55 family RecA-like ATPase